MFRSQLREYERYSSLRIYDRNGAPLLAVDQPSAAAADGANQALMPEVLAQANRLAPRQLWFSPVLWPTSASRSGLPPPDPYVLAVRPLFDRARVRRGVLVFVTQLGPLLQDFDRITNDSGALQRGYMLSRTGTVLNPGGGGRGVNFAARFPEVWKRMAAQQSGGVDTSGGLLRFLSATVLPWKRPGPGGLFLFRRLQPFSPPPGASGDPATADSFRLVVEVPSPSLYCGSSGARRPSCSSAAGRSSAIPTTGPSIWNRPASSARAPSTITAFAGGTSGPMAPAAGATWWCPPCAIPRVSPPTWWSRSAT